MGGNSLSVFPALSRMLPNSDVSEIPIVASYILYIILYFNVIKLYKKGEAVSYTHLIFKFIILLKLLQINVILLFVAVFLLDYNLQK